MTALLAGESNGQGSFLQKIGLDDLSIGQIAKRFTLRAQSGDDNALDLI